MDNMKISIVKNAMNYGAIVGFSLIFVAVVLYFFNITESSIANVFQYIIIFGGIVLGTVSYREKGLDGSISYGNSVRSGTLISLFASIILGFYLFLFFKIIDPAAMEKVFIMAEEQLLSNGTPEEQVEMGMEMYKKMMSPMFMAISTIFTFTIFGLIFSLIASIFIKKELNAFDSAMTDVEEQ